MTVDEALAYVAKHSNDQPAFFKDWEALASLAAEVIRLRAENAAIREVVGRLDTMWRVGLPEYGSEDIAEVIAELRARCSCEKP